MLTKREEKQSFLNKAAQPFVALVEKYYPDPFVFVIALTFVTFAAALLLTSAGPITENATPPTFWDKNGFSIVLNK